MIRARAAVPLLVAAFALSGAAGLMYESAWSRYLGLFVGHSAYAQVVVLVIFLGGMALGAQIAARYSAASASPLSWYVAAELVAGIAALLFHQIFVGATAFAYGSIFPRLDGAVLVAVKWGIASLLILPQAILLGATFPLMGAGVIRLARAENAPGRILALLYFANSMGAAAGVLLAGFVLVAAVGLRGTMVTAGALSVVAAAVTFAVASWPGRRASDPPAPPAPPSGATVLSAEGIAGVSPVLWVAFGTGVASFIYEIAWIRMLSLVLGSATHSFELMLAAFILGLALGALWIRRRADALEDPVRSLGVIQCVMGVLAIATLPLYVQSFDWMAAFFNIVARTEGGYHAFNLFRFALCLLIMLPATICAGMTLPLITRTLMRSGGEAAIGGVYAMNSAGSIVGVVLAALVLMPLIGLKRLLFAGAAIDVALGVWLLAQGGAFRLEGLPARARIRRLFPLIGMAVLFAGIALAAPFDVARLASGVFRRGTVDHTSRSTFPFYADGRTATVTVERHPSGVVTLATNGKPDASLSGSWLTEPRAGAGAAALGGDMATQLIAPMITLAHHPEARSVAVIGHGSGVSSHTLLGSPYATEVATIEIEPRMIEASRHFQRANQRVFEDSRSTFVIDDARAFFSSSGRTWDLIFSEPSNPWVSGVSGLFTVEFYRRIRAALADDGVFGQWLHLYELNDSLINSVLTAIDETFPAYELFYTSLGDILIVAAPRELREPDWGITAYPDIADDLRRVVPFAPEWFETLRLGGRVVLHPLLRDGRANSDFDPVLDLNAERARFLRESATGYLSLRGGRFDLVAALSGRKLGFGVAPFSPTPEIARSGALVLGARLRQLRALPDSALEHARVDPQARAALHRFDRLERMIRAGRPPRDWRSWMQDVIAVDRDLHAGTAGVVDTPFFDMVRRYAARFRAPVGARLTLNFLHGIAAWNWREASDAATVLLAMPDRTAWIPPDLLRDGAVTSFIMARDTARARNALQTLEGAATDAFRGQLLESILDAIRAGPNGRPVGKESR